jgi:Acyl-CoA dehydrogenase, N-terminal domain
MSFGHDPLGPPESCSVATAKRPSTFDQNHGREHMALDARSSRISAPAFYPFGGSTPHDTGGGGFGAQNQPATATADRLLADIRDLAPAIAARSAEFESLRRMPPDIVQALREIGIFRALVPESHGGLELDLLPAFEIMTALSSIDGSVGWVSTIGLGTSIVLPLLPRVLYD